MTVPDVAEAATDVLLMIRVPDGSGDVAHPSREGPTSVADSGPPRSRVTAGTGCRVSGFASGDVGGHRFDGEWVEAKVAYTVQETVELTLIEWFSDEPRLLAPGFKRSSWERSGESCAEAPVERDCVPPRLHHAPPAVGP